MKYDIKKYTYRIEWSEEDNAHIARCLEFPSLAAHGKTPEKALKEIEIVVTESVKWIEEENGIVPEPLGFRRYKGNITLRCQLTFKLRAQKKPPISLKLTKRLLQNPNMAPPA